MGTPTKLKLGAGLALAIAVALPGAPDVQASDHDEAPIVKANAALDITDVYVFDNNGATAIIVAWAGFTDDTNYTQPTAEGVFVDDVLYAINIDEAPFDNEPDHVIYWRFSTNEVDGQKGIQWGGIPDAGTEPVVHAVEEVYTDDASGAKLWAGHHDDPFFFDAVGYLTTLDSAGLDPDVFNLSFSCLGATEQECLDADFLKGLNVSAVVMEIDHAKLGGAAIQVWATAYEK